MTGAVCILAVLALGFVLDWNQRRRQADEAAPSLARWAAGGTGRSTKQAARRVQDGALSVGFLYQMVEPKGAGHARAARRLEHTG